MQVIIEGFKSYKEQVAAEPFSPKHNCVGELFSCAKAFSALGFLRALKGQRDPCNKHESCWLYLLLV